MQFVYTFHYLSESKFGEVIVKDQPVPTSTDRGRDRRGFKPLRVQRGALCKLLTESLQRGQPCYGTQMVLMCMMWFMKMILCPQFPYSVVVLVAWNIRVARGYRFDVSLGRRAGRRFAADSSRGARRANLRVSLRIGRSNDTPPPLCCYLFLRHLRNTNETTNPKRPLLVPQLLDLPQPPGRTLSPEEVAPVFGISKLNFFHPTSSEVPIRPYIGGKKLIPALIPGHNCSLSLATVAVRWSTANSL